MNLFKDLQTLKKQCVIQIESIKKEYENKQIMFFSVTNKVAKIDFVAYSFGALIDSEWVVNELNQLHFNSYADKCKIPRASVFGTYLWNLESPAEMATVDYELNWHHEAVPLYLTKEALKMNSYKLPEQSLAVLTQKQRATLYSHSPFMEGGLLCFYRNAKDFFACKVTKMKPGRALKWMFPEICNEVIKQFVGKLQTSGNLRLVTSKEFVDVYTNLMNTGSCMAAREEKFKNCLVDGEFVHPVSCYGHPDSDISIAAVYEGDLLIGRALVNSELQHSRVFFNKMVPSSEWLVTNLLEKNGYTYSGDALKGRPLLKIEADCGGIICPYIEPGNAGVEVEDDRLVMFGEHGCVHELGMVRGFLGDAYIAYCAECGAFVYEHDEYSFNNNDDIICQHCIHSTYMECYSFNQRSWTYVRNNSSSLFLVKAAGYHDEVSRYDYITDIGESDYVRLDSDYYGFQRCAHIDECSFDSAGYAVLTKDLDRFNLLLTEDYVVESKDDYAWFNLELLCISEVDMSEYELIPGVSGDGMPMYRSKPEV